MSKRRAVVIGINTYQDDRNIPTLKGAVHDATEMATLLREEGDFEIAPEHFLINKNATFIAIRQAISDLLWRVDPCDLSLFYFSGHGLEDGNGAGYFAPYDMYHDQPFVCGISMHEFREILVGAKNKTSIVGLLDCCYSGIATGDKGAIAPALGMDHHFENIPQGTGRTILASSGKDQKSREVCFNCERNAGVEHEHGIFTYHLLDGLQGKAAGPDGNISLDRLCRHVATVMGGSEHAPHQFQSSVSGDTVITTVGRRERIQHHYSQAENYCGEAAQNVYALFAAIDELERLLALAPDLAKVLDLKDRLNRALSPYQRDTQTWLRNKQIVIGARYREEFEFLRSTARNLCVEVVIKQSLTRKNALVCLCRVTMDADAFEDLLAALDEVRNEAIAAQVHVASAGPQVRGAGA